MKGWPTRSAACAHGRAVDGSPADLDYLHAARFRRLRDFDWIWHDLSKDVSWWSEELKLYNAMIVCLCATYTFVQGGHVRVDLVYSVVSYRTKRIIDMVGSMSL